MNPPKLKAATSETNESTGGICIYVLKTYFNFPIDHNGSCIKSRGVYFYNLKKRAIKIHLAKGGKLFLSRRPCLQDLILEGCSWREEGLFITS